VGIGRGLSLGNPRLPMRLTILFPNGGGSIIVEEMKMLGYASIRDFGITETFVLVIYSALFMWSMALQQLNCLNYICSHPGQLNLQPIH